MEKLQKYNKGNVNSESKHEEDLMIKEKLRKRLDEAETEDAIYGYNAKHLRNSIIYDVEKKIKKAEKKI